MVLDKLFRYRSFPIIFDHTLEKHCEGPQDSEV